MRCHGDGLPTATTRRHRDDRRRLRRRTARCGSRPARGPSPGPGEMLLRLRCAGLCGTDLFKLRHGTAAGRRGARARGRRHGRGPGRGRRRASPRGTASPSPTTWRAASAPLPARQRAALPRLPREPAGAGRLLRVGAGAGARRAPAPPSASRLICGRGRRLPGAGGLRAARHPPRPPGGDRPRRPLAGCAADPRRRQHGAPPSAGPEGGPPRPPGRRLRSPGGAPALARRLGADAAAAPGRGDPARGGGALGGLGADAVFDTVGGAGSPGGGAGPLPPGRRRGPLRPCREAGERAGFDLNAFFKSRAPAARHLFELARRSAGGLPPAGRAAARPSPLVTHRLPLSRFAEAVDLARERRALKVLLVPDEPSGHLRSARDRQTRPPS